MGMSRWGLVLAMVLAARAAVAQSPNVNDSFRPGANHHTGDDAFEAKYGHAPTLADERARVHEHFLAVRDWLASRPATRPELAKRRAEILHHFDDYIAKGTTPDNAHLPWRTPVFIDDQGTICAVGYLIEQTVGRPVAERVAEGHRYSYLEEIAAAMPEVQTWVASSGLTLEELSTIQPGYMAPVVETWQAWNLAKDKLPDGPYASEDGFVTGTIAKGKMEGSWSHVDDKQRVLGSGEFKHGAATWTSTYAEGQKLAVGPYANNQPHGTWHFYHPSGNLAAEGNFDHGQRNGSWHFYYDTPAKTPIAIGRFEHASLRGAWKHFDSAGALLATSTDATPRQWNSKSGGFGGYLLEIVPGLDGIRHSVHQGNVAGDHHRLDMVTSKDGNERLYVHAHSNSIYDENGDTLVHDGTTWTSRKCAWNGARKAAARRGDLPALHGLIFHDRFDDPAECAAGKPVAEARAHRIDTMLASIRLVRDQSPDFVRKLALGERSVDDAASTTDNTDDSVATAEASEDGNDIGMTDPNDLAKVLAANMTWYVEWPHVDGRFISVFKTLAGYTTSF